MKLISTFSEESGNRRISHKDNQIVNLTLDHINDERSLTGFVEDWVDSPLCIPCYSLSRSRSAEKEREEKVMGTQGATFAPNLSHPFPISISLLKGVKDGFFPTAFD